MLYKYSYGVSNVEVNSNLILMASFLREANNYITEESWLGSLHEWLKLVRPFCIGA